LKNFNGKLFQYGSRAIPLCYIGFFLNGD